MHGILADYIDLEAIKEDLWRLGRSRQNHLEPHRSWRNSSFFVPGNVACQSYEICVGLGVEKFVQILQLVEINLPSIAKVIHVSFLDAGFTHKPSRL